MFWKDATVEAVPADLAVVHSPIEQCHPVLRTGFGEHVAHMVVHRSFADGETVSDFLIGQSLGDELDDLDLPCLLYTSPSPRDYAASRMPSSA